MPARSRRIAAVWARHLASGLVAARFGLAAPGRRRAALARRARLACEALGPAFVKLGQLASVRPDLFAPETILELEKLQDDVAPVPWPEIRQVLRRELGREPGAVFASLDPEPLASASVAQVHRATLASDYRGVDGRVLPAGSALAVKVLRPGIEGLVSADLEVAGRWARRLARLSRAGRLSPEALVAEFRRSLESELDLRNEGRVADRFARDFADDPLVMVPPVVWRHTTRRVLTTGYVEGWRVSDLTRAERAGIDARGLAAHGAEVFMRQVLVHGRFHADLHPANLFVTPDGRICYLDFGITGRTDPAQREAIAQVLVATACGDADRALRYSRALGLDIPAGDEARVKARVAQLMGRHLAGPGQSDVRGFAIGFLRMLADFGIAVPPGYGLLVKALVTVEGVARAIYPDIDIVRTAGPFATRLVASQLASPGRLARRLPDALGAALDAFAA